MKKGGPGRDRLAPNHTVNLCDLSVRISIWCYSCNKQGRRIVSSLLWGPNVSVSASTDRTQLLAGLSSLSLPQQRGQTDVHFLEHLCPSHLAAVRGPGCPLPDPGGRAGIHRCCLPDSPQLGLARDSLRPLCTSTPTP